MWCNLCGQNHDTSGCPRQVCYPTGVPVGADHTEAWLAEIGRLREENTRLREVVDRLEDQWRTRSPTQEAYDAVCKARTKWQERSEAAEKAACHWDAGQTECGHPEIPGMADDDLSEYCPYCGGSLEVWVTMREGK